MKNYKKEGINIDNWSLQELEQIVRQFQMVKEKGEGLAYQLKLQENTEIFVDLGNCEF